MEIPMTMRYSKVIVYKKSGNTWSSTGTILSNATDIIITTGIGRVKDTFSFKLANPFNELFELTSIIAEDDKIEIYLYNDTDWNTMSTSEKNAAMVMNGVITQFSQTFDEQRIVSIDGAGFTDILFKGLVFFRDAATITKPHLVIQNILQQLNDINPSSRHIYGATPTEWANIGNPTTRRNGTDFPDIQYSASYKTAIEILEDISSYKYTNDGAYFYNVFYNATTSRFELIWDAPENNAANSVAVTENTRTVSGSDIISINLKQNKDKVVNAIIYNVGYDCTETPHEYLYFNPSDASSSNIQWKYMTETNTILTNLIQRECDASAGYWDLDSEGRRTSNFPNTYPYTIATFSDRDDAGAKTTAITCDDGTEFNEAINKEGYWLGRDAASSYVDAFGKAKWEGTVTFGQTNAYTLGALIKLNLSSFNLTNKLIRLKGIKHTIDTTELELEEDAKSVVLAGVMSGS